LQITNIEYRTDKKDKEFIRFALRINPFGTPWSWSTTGWRYFPTEEKLYPPAFKAVKGWSPLVEGVTEKHKQAIIRALERLIHSDESLVALLDEAGTDVDAHTALMLEHGKEYVKSFYDWGKERTDNPEAYELLWETLSSDRQWPDPYLQARAEDIVNGLVSPEEQKQCYLAGAFTEADQLRIGEFLRGLGGGLD